MTIARRPFLLLPLAVAACGGPPPRTVFPPLRYDYLNPIGLNVASIEVEQRAYEVSGPGDVMQLAPVDPIAALRQIAEDRLRAYGSSGRAVFVVTEALLMQRGDGYEGTLGVELDVYPTGSEQRAGYAEARVFRRIESDSDDVRGVLYDLEKQLFDALNVELEFQIRRSLRDWLVAAPTSVPAPVHAQPLPPPS
jgi:hypothetical protein